ncbi:MAG TPA: hypothetical protein VGQ06_10980 [Gemmatimonadales bacterium]|jgi:hypothetical protein|nr:hypothetical protein [Gemmatimonadales bacterium]
MRALAAVLLLILPIRSALGQWFVGLEAGVAAYGGSARDTSNGSGGGPPNFHPGAATMFGIRVGRDIGRWTASLRAMMGAPGLAASGPDLTVTDHTLGGLVEVTPAAAFRVVAVGPTGAVKVEVGPTVAFWNLGDEIRARLAGRAALTYEWPVTGHLGGAIRVDGAIGPSWFDPGDLPAEYERRATWRYGATLGLQYRL